MSTTQINFNESWLIENPLLYNVCGWELDLESLRMQLDYPHREMLEALGYKDIPESLTLLEYAEAFVFQDDHVHLQERLMHAIDQSDNSDYNDRFELRLKSADGIVQSYLVNSWQLRPGLLRGQGQNISDLKEAKARIAQTSASLRAVIENSTDYVFILSPEGTLLHYNRLFADVMRDFHQVECSEGINLIEEISPALAEVWTPLFERSKQGERIVEELDVKLNDLHRVEVAVNPVMIAGVIDSISFFIRDITSKWRISRIDELETKAFEQAFRKESIVDVFDDLILGMQSLAPGMIGYVTRRRENAMVLEWLSHPSLPQSVPAYAPQIPIDERSGSCGLAAVTQQSVYVSDVREHECWDDHRDICMLNGLWACFSFPLFDRDGVLLGTLGAYFREVHELTAFEESVLTRMCKVVEMLLERDKAERKAKAQSLQLAAISHSIPGVLYVLKGDTSGNRQMEFLSNSATRFFDKLPEILGDYQAMRTALEPQDLDSIDRKFKESLRDRSLLDVDFSIRREYLPRFNRFHIQAYHDVREDGTVYTYGYITDISQRTRIEEEKQQKSQLLEVINTLSVQLIDATEPENGILKMMGSIGEFLHADRVYLFRNETQTDGEIYSCQTLEWVVEGVEPQIENKDLKRFALRQHGFERWVQVLGAGESLSGNVKDFPEAEQRVLSEQDIQSILVVPVMIQDQWWGFLGIDACRSERDWLDYEISAMLTTANLVGAVMRQFEYRKSLKDVKVLYQASIDTMAEGLLIKDAEGVILTCNQSGLRILRMEPDQVIGKSTYDSEWNTVDKNGNPMPGRDHASMVAVRSGKEVMNQIMGLPAGDGSFRWLSVNANPIFYSGSPRPSAVVATFTDITEKIATDRQLEQTALDAQRSLRSLYNNCTNSLRMASLLLELEAVVVKGEGRSAQESSRRVRSLYRIQEALFLQPETSSGVVMKLLEDLCAAITRQFGRNPGEIQFKVITRTGQRKSGALMPVMMILNELIANAVEHGLATRLTGEIEIKAEEQGDYLVTEVVDNGVGLPPSFNISEVKTLGLSIVKALLEGMEGTIAMHSARGTRVLITIPLKSL